MHYTTLPCQKSLPFVRCISVLDYEMNSYKPLEMKAYVKYLGVYIDADLSWKHYIDHTSRKISKCVGVIAKLRHFVSRQTLVSIFQSLIWPYLTCDICAWGQGTKVHTNTLLILQKRTLRLMFFAKRRDHAILFFKQTRSLPLTFLYFERLSLMHDVYHPSVPSNLRSMLRQTTHVHNYNRTRSASNQHCYVEYSRTEKRKKSFPRTGALISKGLPKSLKSLRKSQFISKIKKILLEFLQKADDYTDVLQTLCDIKQMKML